MGVKYLPHGLRRRLHRQWRPCPNCRGLVSIKDVSARHSGHLIPPVLRRATSTPHSPQTLWPQLTNHTDRCLMAVKPIEQGFRVGRSSSMLDSSGPRPRPSSLRMRTIGSRPQSYGQTQPWLDDIRAMSLQFWRCSNWAYLSQLLPLG